MYVPDDPYSFAHIAFNMMTLVSVVIVLERAVGSRVFTCLRFAGGVSAPLVAWWWMASTGSTGVHLGSSGAIFGSLEEIHTTYATSRNRIANTGEKQMCDGLDPPLWKGIAT